MTFTHFCWKRCAVTRIFCDAISAFPNRWLGYNNEYVFLGIVNSDGSLWKTQRRYLLNQRMGMRHWASVGMEHIEILVRTQCAKMCLTFTEDCQDEYVDPENIINCYVANVICKMIMSREFNYRDVNFQHFIKLFDEGFKLFSAAGVLIFLPFLKFLPGISDSCKKLKTNREETVRFVQQVIREHKAELNFNAPNDLMDSYLIEIERKKNGQVEEGQDIFQGVDGQKQLEQIILDLFSAGVETLKTSLQWSIVYMIHYQEVLAQVQKEMMREVGPNRFPTLDDIPNLPYTRATMYEVMRRSSVVPMGTTHATNR